MSSGRGGTKKKHYTKTKQDDENEMDQVERLLRATEDDILLKLSVDSHMSRASSSHAIHPDLDRRFQALRSSSSNSKPPEAEASVVVNDDDLFARFAALKSTIPSYSNKNQQHVEVNDHGGDEVDEVIRWAIDAAALDPSPPSDISSDDDDEDDDSDVSSDEDDEDPKPKEKEKTNGKQK